MMEIQDIIDSINTLMDKDNTLILHRSMKEHPKFKVYKIFGYNLYLLDSKGDKSLLLAHSFTVNTLYDDILDIWKKYDKEYLPILFKWLITNSTQYGIRI